MPVANWQVTVFGIPNCDTVKKSRAWFTEHGVDFVFHDFKKQGLDAAVLSQWLEALGWELVLNRKGTSWRKLDESTRALVVDAQSAQAVIASNLSLIKRPIVVFQEQGTQTAPTRKITVGFTPETWQALLGIESE